MVEKKFPENFWWGAATSGPQCEGSFNKKNKNAFDYWFEIEPEVFFNRVGPSIASNFYNNYEEDIKLIKQLGLNSFRTSIQWTRLIKDFETLELDKDGVEFYNKVIDKCVKNSIIPVICLHHFDLPVELYHKYGGWESKYVTDLYAGFAEKCFELFSDRVKHWTTFNEPIVIVEGQYLYQFHYPKIIDGKKAVQAAFNINLSSAKAIKIFKEKGYSNSGKIGIVVNLTPSYARSNSEEDEKASFIADMFFNRLFLDPAVKGEFPKELTELLKEEQVIWQGTQEEMDIIKNNRVDFVGVNYYQPRRVKAKESIVDTSQPWMPDKYFDNYEMPGRRMNIYRDWEIYPKGIYDIAINLRDNYDNIPWYISENGMGVEGEERFRNSEGIIEDDYRIDFIKEHLEYLHKAIEEGANCFGYHLWTPIDCWSWCNAYKNRYGYISLDLDTQNKTIKKSGYWMMEVSKNNGV